MIINYIYKKINNSIFPITLEKITSFLYYSILFFLPYQTFKSLFIEEAIYAGKLIDYFLPKLYFLDILIIIYIIFSLINYYYHFYRFSKYQKLIILYFIVFQILLLIFNPKNLFIPPSSIIYFKILELSLFIIINILQPKNFFKASSIYKVISWSSMIVSSITIFEFIFQKSLGLQILGEWYFDRNQISYPVFFFAGHKFIRPRACFPHPNLNSFYLSTTLLINYYLVLFFKDSNKNDNQLILKTNKFKPLLFFTLNLIASLLTFSRLGFLLVISGTIIVSIYAFFHNSNNLKLINLKIKNLSLIFIILGVIFMPLFISRFNSLNSDDSLSLKRRTFLNLEAKTIIQHHFISGVGLNKFLENLSLKEISNDSFFFQPVHNYHLLFLAENGLINFLYFLFIILFGFIRQLLYFLKNFKFSRLLILTFYLFFFLASFWDHYFYSLFQGNLILYLFLSLSLII